MNTQEIANKFYEMAQKGAWNQIQDELFHQECESIEPSHSAWRNVKGIDAIKEKGKNWGSQILEAHGGYCNVPMVVGNHFTCKMGMDVTLKESGRMKLDEIAVYEVKDGKIIKEQFFF